MRRAAKNLPDFLPQKQPERLSKPQTFNEKKTKNVLELANGLCKAANQNIDFVVDQQVNGVPRFFAFSQKFAREHAGEHLTGKDLEKAFRRHEEEENSKLGRTWLRQQLAFLVDHDCWPLVDAWETVDRSTGRRVIKMANLFQDLLLDVRNHPKIDLRRFARCANDKCRAFFYKRRATTSRACSRKCEDILMSREYSAREKQNRAKALALYSQGKTAFQIAPKLKVSVARVRAYLKR
jgi:hypothetical protein